MSPDSAPVPAPDLATSSGAAPSADLAQQALPPKTSSSRSNMVTVAVACLLAGGAAGFYFGASSIRSIGRPELENAQARAILAEGKLAEATGVIKPGGETSTMIVEAIAEGGDPLRDLFYSPRMSKVGAAVDRRLEQLYLESIAPEDSGATLYFFEIPQQPQDLLRDPQGGIDFQVPDAETLREFLGEKQPSDVRGSEKGSRTTD